MSTSADLAAHITRVLDDLEQAKSRIRDLERENRELEERCGRSIETTDELNAALTRLHETVNGKPGKPIPQGLTNIAVGPRETVPTTRRPAAVIPKSESQ